MSPAANDDQLSTRDELGAVWGHATAHERQEADGGSGKPGADQEAEGAVQAVGGCQPSAFSSQHGNTSRWHRRTRGNRIEQADS